MTRAVLLRLGRVAGASTAVLVLAACTTAEGDRSAGPGASAAPTTATSAAPTAATSGPGQQQAGPTPSSSTSDFGYVVSAREEVDGWHISFDRAVFLRDDPEQHIRNDNPLLRDLRLSPDVQLVGTLGWAAFLGEDTSRVEEKPRTMSEFIAYVNSDAGPAPFHVRYRADGRVVGLREQYLP